MKEDVVFYIEFSNQCGRPLRGGRGLKSLTDKDEIAPPGFLPRRGEDLNTPVDWHITLTYVVPLRRRG